MNVIPTRRRNPPIVIAGCAITFRRTIFDVIVDCAAVARTARQHRLARPRGKRDAGLPIGDGGSQLSAG